VQRRQRVHARRHLRERRLRGRPPGILRSGSDVRSADRLLALGRTPFPEVTAKGPDRLSGRDACQPADRSALRRRPGGWWPLCLPLPLPALRLRGMCGLVLRQTAARAHPPGGTPLRPLPRGRTTCQGDLPLPPGESGI